LTDLLPRTLGTIAGVQARRSDFPNGFAVTQSGSRAPAALSATKQQSQSCSLCGDQMCCVGVIKSKTGHLTNYSDGHFLLGRNPVGC
jgi:hypothetical protein